jgi:hypothetical protein
MNLPLTGRSTPGLSIVISDHQRGRRAPGRNYTISAGIAVEALSPP